MFAAEPENVWSELHHFAGWISVGQIFSGATATLTTWRICRPFAVTSTTSAAAGAAKLNTRAKANAFIASLLCCATRFTRNAP